MKYAPEKTILIDFDGTLASFNWPKPPGIPFEGVVEAIKLLKRKGFQVVIFTARAWSGWDKQVESGYREKQIKEVEDWLTKHGIPWDAITAEKMPSLAIIDDRAIRVSKYTNWSALAKGLIEEAASGEYGSYRTTSEKQKIPRNPRGTRKAT